MPAPAAPQGNGRSFVLLAGIRLPDDPAVNEMLNEPLGKQLEWSVGNELITQGGPQRVMFWARLPLILLSTLLGLLVYVWGRQIAGDVAGVGALFLFALDPNLVAHSELVTTDMGLAAFMTLFFFSLWTWLRRPSLARLLWCGFAMGLLLCAKFSAVFMIPVALLLMLAAALLTPRTEGQSAARPLIEAFGKFAVMSVVAALVIMAVYFSPYGLSEYCARAPDWSTPNHNPNYLAFMANEVQHRFISYFAVAWLLKEPLATIAFVILGSVALIRGERFTVLDKLVIFLPPVVLFIACTILADNIGIRYVIPAFPFACLAGGVGLAALIGNRSKWALGLAGVLCLWLVVAAAGIFPDHLSYFNEAACLLDDPGNLGFDGGTRCGPSWLDDSNTDWGQGLIQLRTWRNAHPDPRPIRMPHLWSFPPEAYGIISQTPNDSDIVGYPSPGLYVISASMSRG